MQKKIVGTVEARMSSSRLPGKVLMPLAGEPALKRLVARMRKSKYLNEVVIATTINKIDDAIIDFCNINKIKFYRGSEEDILSRILEVAKKENADWMVGITGDCPLVDYRHIDRAIEIFAENKYDYVYNDSFPNGFDVQVFSVALLEKVDKLTNDPIDRVHGTYYISRHPKEFRLRPIKAEGKMNWPQLAVTLDEMADYKLLNIIFENLLPQSQYFSAEDVVDFLLKNPQLLEINRNVRRKTPAEG